MLRGQVERVPAVSLCSSSVRHRLHKDAQFLQTHVSSRSHTDDTDAQTVAVWRHTDRHNVKIIKILDIQKKYLKWFRKI